MWSIDLCARGRDPWQGEGTENDVLAINERGRSQEPQSMV